MRTKVARWSLSGFGAFVLLFFGGAAGAAHQAGASSTGERGASYRVTLITGDVVQVDVQPGGLQAATVQAAPRGDGLPQPSFQIVRTSGDVYIYPSDAAPFVGDELDRELFNVSKLVEQGLADGEAESLPIIVDYGQKVGATPPAMVKEDTLESIDAAVVREPKSKAAAFGRAVAEQAHRKADEKDSDAATAATGQDLFAGIERIWLDERVEAALDVSVPQIGAPTAWAAGYDGTGVKVAVLDTGIDAGHPDLAGKIAVAQNFTTTADATDHHGHGTHVASTVAGSGAASGGLRKGVAPGATLAIGKVLDDGGFGLDSWIIAGMEWAARDEDADVISMSLGGGRSDGSDPMSQAVDNLTAETGALFTIAAGNIGPGRSTVSTPGAASAALTVGAVNSADVLAGFSGRGPRLGDFAIKPDITAPGVEIGAARAAGTSLGTPIDAFYTRLSGTSMATPHVAGAAAILQQRHPDWDATELKAALVNTASPGSGSVYEQGGGRVDLHRAFTQPEVLASPAPIDLGHFPWPHDADQPVTKSVTYTNLSDASVTLDLTLAVSNALGDPPAAGMLTVEPQSVILSPGSSQSVDLTVDTTLGAVGLYGGYLVAEDAAAETIVRTPVGFNKEPEMHNLTVDAIARDGRPARGISWVDVVNTEDTTIFQGTKGLGNGPVTFRVPPGTYSVMGMLFTYDAPQVFATEVAVVGDPELEVKEDKSIVLDARPATEVLAKADQPTELRTILIGTYRAASAFGSWESLLLASPPIDRAFTVPTEPVTIGDFGFRAKPTLSAPEIEISLTKPKLPLDVTYAGGSKRFDGRARLDLVYAGYGRVQDFEGLDVRGKAVLVSRGPLPPVGNPITFVEKVANATAAGAALLIIHNHSPGLLLIGLASSEIPVFSMERDQGIQVRDLIAQARRTVDVLGTYPSPYIYDVLFADRGYIRDTHTLTLNRSNTVQVAAEYRSHVDSWLGGDAHHNYPPWSNFSFEGVRNITTPFARTEYVSTGDSRWWHLAWGSMTNEHVFEESQQDVLRRYPSPGSRSDTWFGQPQRPGIVRAFELGADEGQPVTREGNVLTFFIPEFTDDTGRYGFMDGRTDTAAFRLFENNALIASGGRAFADVPVSESPATYRTELDVTRTAPFWAFSTETHTAWTFASAPPAPDTTESVPLLVVDYDLGKLDGRNRARLGTHPIGLFVHRQQGAAPAPVTGLTVQASYDDGATWVDVQILSLGGGNFTAMAQNPIAQAGGHVSLRVRATDAGGSAFDQTIIRAYGIE